MFATTAREVKITAPAEKETTPPPTLSVDPSGRKPPVAALVTHAINVGMHSARSSMRSSKTAQSASRGFKKAKKTALLTLRIGEYVVKTQVCGRLRDLLFALVFARASRRSAAAPKEAGFTTDNDNRCCEKGHQSQF